jgi:hypothetical protein
MDANLNIAALIKQGEGEKIEFKAVLPPAKSLAKIIAAFANCEGGHLVLGISDDGTINGLSDDLYATSITHQALDLLSAIPLVEYWYLPHGGKLLFIISVQKSPKPIYLNNKIYKRIGLSTLELNAPERTFKDNGYERLSKLYDKLDLQRKGATHSKLKTLNHYQGILKILDDLNELLYPVASNRPTDNQEGKVLCRILYSSLVDSFETYLADLLYEIFLAKPETLKSDQTITITEVLNCADLQEFVKYWAREQLSRLQKGGVAEFVKGSKQINDLKVLDKPEILEIEKILQIRRLYAHQNGIIDDKFLKTFKNDYTANTEYTMSVEEMCAKLEYLITIVERLDIGAAVKYKLAVMY